MTRRPASIASSIVLSLLALQAPAAADSAAQAGRSTATATGRWAAVARITTSTATSGALPRAFTWTSATRNQTVYQRFDLANVGTLAMTGAIISIPPGIVASNWSGTGTPSASITVRLCNGGTWSAGGNCSSGNATTLPTTAGPTSCSNLSAACSFVLTSNLGVGQERALIMGMTSGRAGTYSLTISAAVDRSRVRAAIVRNA